MKAARGVLSIIAVCVVQVLLARYLPPVAERCDLFTILVVYYGLSRPPTGAMVMGAGSGLVQDALVGSILGLNGFKKTLIGYLVGTLGSLFMLNQAIPRFGILFAATILDQAAELGLSMVMGQSLAFSGIWLLVQRGLGNGVLGLLTFWIAARIP
jgi:rod shape-determining protein MreD